MYLSNEIRFVLNTSRLVNLAAQNASLAARRAGKVRGFQAVTVELKTFSQKLSGAMEKMSWDVMAIVKVVSAGYKLQRAYHYQQATFRIAGASSDLASVLASGESSQDNIRTDLVMRKKSLEQHLIDSQGLCNNGRALARSALIEASSGGDSEVMLRNVAQDIVSTIEDIHARLRSIGLRLRNDQEYI